MSEDILAMYDTELVNALEGVYNLIMEDKLHLGYFYRVEGNRIIPVDIEIEAIKKECLAHPNSIFIYYDERDISLSGNPIDNCPFLAIFNKNDILEAIIVTVKTNQLKKEILIVGTDYTEDAFEDLIYLKAWKFLTNQNKTN